jgi:heavy metal sensor kinase
MKRMPIGVRLTLWYLLMFATAQTLFGVGMWSILHYNLYDIADDALEAQVDDVQRLLNALDQEGALRSAFGAGHSGEYLRVTNEQGTDLYRGALVKSPALKAGQLSSPIYEDRRIDDKPVRMLTARVKVDGRHYIVQAGQREYEVLATLASFRRYLMLIAPLLLLVAAVAGYWLSRRALAPVDALTRAAAGISGANLGRRLEALESGDELQRLSETLNDMLARIESQFLRVSQFTADASHELRTPIALIRTEAEIALRKPRDEAEYREALLHILSEAVGTSELLETLLSLARADAGREMLIMAPLDLAQLSRRVAEDWRPRLASRLFQVTENPGAMQLPISGNAEALSRLLNILVDNATKYTSDSGKIEIILEKNLTAGVVKVCDNGIGISPEEQSKIFERFYQVDKARTRECSGVGLGLAIADWIVKRHGGSLTVESAPGQGSTFIMKVPLC